MSEKLRRATNKTNSTTTTKAKNEFVVKTLPVSIGSGVVNKLCLNRIKFTIDYPEKVKPVKTKVRTAYLSLDAGISQKDR